MAASLIPRAFLLTPNLEEAAVLAGFPVTDIASMRKAAEKLASLGAKNVLIKGGHLEGDDAVDVLYEPEHGFHEFSRAAHRDGAHPRDGMHVFGRHHGGAGERRGLARGGRPGQGIHHRGDPHGAGAGLGRGAAESSRVGRADSRSGCFRSGVPLQAEACPLRLERRSRHST